RFNPTLSPAPSPPAKNNASNLIKKTVILVRRSRLFLFYLAISRFSTKNRTSCQALTLTATAPFYFVLGLVYQGTKRIGGHPMTIFYPKTAKHLGRFISPI